MDLPNIHNIVPQADDILDVFEVHILAEARQLMRTIRNMTYQLVEDPYFPLMFPYVHEYYQVHGAVPVPENVEEDDDEIAPPILVQIPQHEDFEEVVWGPGENPQGPYELEEPEEDPEEPEDPKEEPIEWESDNEEMENGEKEPLERAMAEVMDIYLDSGDVPPPPFESDIGAYRAQLPIIF
ncbi:hypothetical protein RHMOL_Rhmol02G0174500 [Rhododendron molle]|uniref:Uncharacterized protein n=1 Tax=Rhododendron molle TaxID=49168 RepID=A0ACC0PSL1_RHOML|nr:hypothetical protein RHMOL_Rhmol02G0174500 [Rhododendron molle]